MAANANTTRDLMAPSLALLRRRLTKTSRGVPKRPLSCRDQPHRSPELDGRQELLLETLTRIACRRFQARPKSALQAAASFRYGSGVTTGALGPPGRGSVRG